MEKFIRFRPQARDKKIVSALQEIIAYAVEEDRVDLLGIAVHELERITHRKNNEVEAREVDLSQPSLASKGFQSPEKRDGKDAAFEEMQRSLREAARLTSLDVIREHDNQFARSLADLPDEEWNRTGDEMKIPFRFSYETDVDIEAIILSMLDDDGGSDTKDSAEDANESSTPLTIREGKNPMNSTGKGKEKVSDEGNTSIISSTGKGIEKVDEGSTSIMSSTRKGNLRKFYEESYDSTHFIPSLDLEVEASEPDWETFCQICFDSEQSTSTFVTLEGCGHRFCEKCVKRHAEARVDGGQMNVTCLLDECPAFVSDMQLSSLLSSAMLDILARRQVEAAIPASEILYCPFKECSALFIKPASEPSSSAHPPTSCVECEACHRAISAHQPATCVECEACHRAFCVDCMVPWHGDKSCGEYRADLKNESLQGDEKFLKLAKKQKWQRCTKCGRVVDLSHGCYHIRCLCKHEFCFLCGVEMYGKVKKCRCPLWEEARL